MMRCRAAEVAFEVFESAWVLYYLSELPLTREEVEPALTRPRTFLPAGG